MGAEIPLSTLLSSVLIAYTMELDNELEHRMAAEVRDRAVRVSLVLWENFLRFVGPEGATIGEILTCAGVAPQTLHMYLAMERWGYIMVEPDRQHRPPGRPRSDWMVRRTPVGEKAATIWTGLDEVIEQRWVDRFGAAAVSDLRHSLQAIVGDLGVDRPRFLPIVGFADGMRAHAPSVEDRRPMPSLDGGGRLSLASLLSLVLLELTLDFEQRSELSLALCANVLRALGAGVPRLRDLPALTGVPKETVRVSVGFLVRHGYAAIETDCAARAKTASLTLSGRQALCGYPKLLQDVRATWEARFGRAAVEQLGKSLHSVVARRDGGRYRLSDGLVPYPEGWRAGRPYLTQTRAVIENPTTALPHYPLVTHRGGWPDGS